MGREANKFFKKLADKLSRKSGQRYNSEAMTFIRKRVKFDLLRTATVIALTLRGERGLKSSSAASKNSRIRYKFGAKWSQFFNYWLTYTT